MKNMDFTVYICLLLEVISKPSPTCFSRHTCPVCLFGSLPSFLEITREKIKNNAPTSEIVSEDQSSSFSFRSRYDKEKTTALLLRRTSSILLVGKNVSSKRP